MKTYTVTWDTYRNRVHTEWQKEIEAKNASLARERFYCWWWEHEGCTYDPDRDRYYAGGTQKVRHPFHVEVRLKRS